MFEMTETRIGKFKGAVDPSTNAFREFPSWVEERLQPTEPEAQRERNESEGTKQQNIENQVEKKPPRVAMYCTGGIRCEKASSFLLSKGCGEVYPSRRWNSEISSRNPQIREPMGGGVLCV